jgi:hypothetical protein
MVSQLLRFMSRSGGREFYSIDPEYGKFRRPFRIRRIAAK